MSRIKPERYINESYGRGDRYLKKYYQKAVDEENRAEAVQALLSLADYNLLFNRPAGANYYYQKAWSEAQALPADHPIVLSFDGPVALPAFEYAEKRREVKRKKPSVYVPIRFDVEKSGRVVRVQAKPDNDDELKMFTRARRAARRLIFRPIIEQGKLVGARQVSHQVRVQLRADEVDSTEKSNK